MERGEEKTQKTKRKRRRRQSSSLLKSTPSFPLDLTSAIFLKLPAKSVVRFRSVSKHWSTITTEPYFTNTFETRPKLLLLFFKYGDELFVFSLSQHNQNPSESYSYYSARPIDSYRTTYPKSCYFSSRESVHGLICYQTSGKPLVWNPTMRKFLLLPKPDKNWKDISVFLGYDPIESKHKVICMPDAVSDECRVFTLGSDPKSWRRIKTNYNHRPFSGNRSIVYGQCINGVLYYKAELTNYDLVIMRFDVRSEKFSVITLPWEGSRQMKLITYERRLAFVVDSFEDSISVWLLEDAEKIKWSNHTFLPFSHYKKGLKNFKLIGITDDGEFIYVQITVLKLFPVIYIHPTRKTFRRVEYRGIADDNFRQRNGLGDRRLRELHLFPNHIETLLSL